MPDLPLDLSTQAALQERVKELACLYGIAQLAAHPESTLDQVLQGVVDLLPPAWYHPQMAQARIALDGREWRTPGFRESPACLASEIVIAGRPRGSVNVAYPGATGEADAGFLREERQLIDAIAKQVALIIERRDAEQARAELQMQLQQADRLATIGVLAAGVAHELNEPLGNILGFTQILSKAPDLPGPVLEDLRKIETASLQAREIIRNLLVFSRRLPPRRRPVALNHVVEEGLKLLRPRCVQGNIELTVELAPDLPQITGDDVQLNQVLVSLVVNAIQAMPSGGRLCARTRRDGDFVILTIRDSGIGMDSQTLHRIFDPFFTTKDEGKGTGLGLPIVQEIVKAHGGDIHVKSKPGKGAEFEVRIPTNHTEEHHGQ